MLIFPQSRLLPKVACGKSSMRCLAVAEDQDTRRIIHEAQSSLMKINQSRLKALAELRSAKERIAQLEGQLAAVKGNTPRASAATAAEPRSSTSNSQEPSNQRTTIVYGTGWEQVYVHYKTQSRDWTPIPGQAMVQDEKLQGCKVATLDTTERVEFVLNNGANEWDSPYSGAKNYIVEGPGTWHLKSGKLQKLG